MAKTKKYPIYELDFGDTNLLSEDLSVILDWIKSDIQSLKKEGDDYQSTITLRFMTRKQINDLPEWS